MSEQGVDLRSTWAVLRRRRGALALAGLFGAVAGAGLLYVLPSPYTSTSVVLLPTATQSGAGRTGGYDAETQVVIAQSAQVLGRAGLAVTPNLSSQGVGDRVTVEAPTSSIIRFTARGTTSDEAEQLAEASAQSLVGYLEESANELSQTRRGTLQDRLDTLKASLASLNAQISKTSARLVGESPASSAGRADAAAVAALTASQGQTVLEIDNVQKELSGDEGDGGLVAAGASVIQGASPGEQSEFVTRALTFVAGGAAVFVAVTALFLALTNRRDPKLRSRDEIADAVGIPVLASFRTRPARTAKGWVELLEDYAPANVDGWALRQLIRAVTPSPAGPEAQPWETAHRSWSSSSACRTTPARWPPVHNSPRSLPPRASAPSSSPPSRTSRPTRCGPRAAASPRSPIRGPRCPSPPGWTSLRRASSPCSWRCSTATTPSRTRGSTPAPSRCSP